jgi:hypothetical protein
MNDYWDLSEKERSVLTREDCKKYIAYELMRKGVAGIPEPIYEDEGKPISMPNVEIVYNIDIGYNTIVSVKTMDEVNIILTAFSHVDPGSIGSKSVYDYRSKYDNPKFFESWTESLKVVKTEVYPEAELNAIQEVLQEQGVINRRNTDKRNEYTKANKEIDTALSDMWEDWERCCALGERNRGILATYSEYEEMCEGNSEMALGFLAKAYSEDEIDEAFEWEKKDER